MCVFLVVQHFCFVHKSKSHWCRLFFRLRLFDRAASTLTLLPALWPFTEKLLFMSFAAPQKSNRKLSDTNWKVCCHNDLRREITTRYLSSWQRAVSVASTPTVRRRPLIKKENLCGTWSLLTQCFKWQYSPQTWRRYRLPRGTLYQAAAPVYSLNSL